MPAAKDADHTNLPADAYYFDELQQLLHPPLDVITVQLHASSLNFHDLGTGRSEGHGVHSERLSDHKNCAWGRRTLRRREEMIEADRQVADPFACRVIDRVRNSRGRSNDTEFANALDAERIDDLVFLVKHLDRDLTDIR